MKTIDAIDISEILLEFGLDLAKQADIGNIYFFRGRLREFNAADNSLAGVLGPNIIHWVPDRKAEIAEVARVLKPGGL